MSEGQRPYTPLYHDVVTSRLYRSISGDAMHLYWLLRRYVCRARSGHSLSLFYLKGFLAVSGYLGQYAKLFDVSESTISRRIKELVDHNLISVYQRGREDRPTIWILGRVIHIEGSQYGEDIFFLDHLATAQEEDEETAVMFDRAKMAEAFSPKLAALNSTLALLQVRVQAQMQGSNRKDQKKRSITTPADAGDGEDHGQAGESDSGNADRSPVSELADTEVTPELSAHGGKGSDGSQDTESGETTPRGDTALCSSKGQRSSAGRKRPAGTTSIGQLLARKYGSGSSSENGDREPARDLEILLQLSFGMRGKRMATGKAKDLMREVKVGDPNNPGGLLLIPCPMDLYDTVPLFKEYVQRGIDWALTLETKNLAGKRNACIGWICNYTREPSGWIAYQAKGGRIGANGTGKGKRRATEEEGKAAPTAKTDRYSRQLEELDFK